MEAPDEIRRIVERYMLNPGESITGIRVGTAGALVSARGAEWMVRPMTQARNFVKSEGYTLYDIGPAETDVRGSSHGVAVTPDGSTYHLNDREDFRGFYQAVRAVLTPLELAGLLAFYQSDLPGESVIAAPEDLGWLFPDGSGEDLPVLPRPEVEERGDGGMTLLFSTLALSQDPPNYVYRVNLNEWRVDADGEGRLEWSSRPVARGVDSPRYAPR
jgi:hypothetical protein